MQATCYHYWLAPPQSAEGELLNALLAQLRAAGQQGHRAIGPPGQGRAAQGRARDAEIGCRGPLEQGSSEGSLCGDCKQAGPWRHPDGDRGKTAVARCRAKRRWNRTVSVLNLPPVSASLGTAKFGVSAVTLTPGSSIECAAWQGVCTGQRRAETHAT